MSKNSIETRVFIPAPPQKVWSVLTDFASYPSWNPFIRQVQGALVTGSDLKISIETQPGAKWRQFSPQIISVIPNQELRWLGHLMIPNIIFTGEHYFLLEAGENGTYLSHGEDFTGLLAGMIGVKRFKPSFEAMNDALAREVASRDEA